MDFSRQEYWSGLPFPSPRDLPYPGIEPRSPTFQADSLPSEPPGKACLNCSYIYNSTLSTTRTLKVTTKMDICSWESDDTYRSEKKHVHGTTGEQFTQKTTHQIMIQAKCIGECTTSGMKSISGEASWRS